MKKHHLTSALLAAVLLLSACGEKEGIFNPGRKLSGVETTLTSIKHVRANETDEWVYDTTHIYTNGEQWTWADNHLANIRYGSDANDELLQFEYDGDRVIRITEQRRDLRIEVKYDGRKVDSIIMYSEDYEVCRATFSHRHGKVSCIEESEFEPMLDGDAKALFRRVVGMDMIDESTASVGDRAAQATKDNAPNEQWWRTRWLDLEWDGDNIATAKLYEDSHNEPAATVYTYTYDNAHNPYAGMTFMGLTGDSPVGQTGRLNANNVVCCKRTHSTSSHTLVEEYTYTYSDGWPVSRTHVEVLSYYLPAFHKYMMVTDSTVTRYTYLN